jgi:hypothetical protein
MDNRKRRHENDINRAENKIISQKNILTLFCCAILSLIYISNIKNLYQLYVLNDEFGYWANAAYFTGYDWSGAASISPYYSYGYSLFLAPLLKVIANPLTRYRAAIVLNVIFYVLGFVLSVRCADDIFSKKIKASLKVFVCFFVALYCNNLVQVNITWGEALMYFMFWLVIDTFMLYQKEKKLGWLLAFLAEISYMYMIHQRALGIVAAGITVLLIEFVVAHTHRRINIKRVLSVMAIVFACIALSVVLKGALNGNLWSGQDANLASQNDYAGQLEKIIYCVSSAEGLMSALSSFAGKTLYLICASCGLLLWGVICCIKRMCSLKSTRKYVYLFMLLSLIYTTVISSIFMVYGGSRVDCVLYGRYTEMIVGPLLLAGLARMLGKKGTWREFVAGECVILASTLISLYALKTASTYTSIHSVGSSLFYNDHSDKFLIWYYMAFGMLAYLLWYISSMLGIKKYRFVAVIIPIIFSAAYWGICTDKVLDREINAEQKYMKITYKLADFLEKMPEDTELFFTRNYQVADFFNRRIENIQYAVKDKTIKLTNLEELSEKDSDNYFLIQYGLDGIDLDKYDIIMQGYGMYIMAVRDSAAALMGFVEISESPLYFDETMMSSETASEAYTFEALHNQGFMLISQPLTLTRGMYEVTMSLNAENMTDETIGYFDVSSEYGLNVEATNVLTREAVEEMGDGNGNIDIVYTFWSEDVLDNVEFRFYSCGNADVKLNSLSYRRIE